MSAPARRFATSSGTLNLGVRPVLMGIVNATPDSFSDAGLHRTLDERVALARSLLDAGAEIIDIGGESGVTNAPAVDPSFVSTSFLSSKSGPTGSIAASATLLSFKCLLRSR